MSLPHSNAVSEQTFLEEAIANRLLIAPAIAPKELVSPRAVPAIEELAQLDQWVFWKYVTRKGKRDKPPFNPHTGRMASHSNPADWGRYAQARVAGDGRVGFVFHETDPYCGIDLDGCRDHQTGAIEDWAQRIIDLAHSYSEISPSDTGVKIFVRGKLPGVLLHSLGEHKGIEVYSTARYFTVTGNHLPGTPLEIHDAQPTLDLLWKEYHKEPAPKAVKPSTARRAPKSTPGERAVARDVIDRLNGANDLGDYLESKGASLVRTVGNVRYYDGLAGDTHKNSITYIVSPAKSGGGHIGYSYSPNGKLSKADFPHGFKWFDAVCALEYSGVALDVLKALNPIKPRKQAIAEPEYVLCPVERERRAKDAQRKRDARRAETAGIRQAIIDQAAADTELSPRARRQLSIHLRIAGTRGWHRASVARQAELTGVGERAVQFANQELIERGYLTRELTSGITTAIWTFTLRSPVETSASKNVATHCDAKNAGRSPVLDHETYVHDQPIRASEAAPELPPTFGEPETLDEWEGCEAPIGDEVINWLYEQEHIEARPASTPSAERDLLSYVRALAKELKEPGDHAVLLRDYAELTTAELMSEAARLEAALAADEVASDELMAWYDPAADWTAGGRLDLSHWRDPSEVRAAAPGAQLDKAPEAEPLVRSAPTEPKAAAEYWSLKHMKPKSSEQAKWVRRRLAELEIVVPALQVPTSPPPIVSAGAWLGPAHPARAAPPSPAPLASQAQLSLFVT
jgi:hypothetical protein